MSARDVPKLAAVTAETVREHLSAPEPRGHGWTEEALRIALRSTSSRAMRVHSWDHEDGEGHTHTDAALTEGGAG